MNIQKIPMPKILGVVGCISKNKILNLQDLNELFDNKPENVIKATGFVSKSIAEKNVCAIDMSIAAAKHLIKNKNIDVNKIGALINVSFTQEYLMPGDATKAQIELGLNNNIIAFDIDMACSGYIYGFYLASVLANLHNKYVLLLNGDTQSKFTSRKDKSTLPVMADAGTATLFGPSTNSNDEAIFSFYSNGNKQNSLYIPHGRARNPLNESSLKYSEVSPGSFSRPIDIFMDGFEIYKFVATEVSSFINEFLIVNQIKEPEIHRLAFHQANIYMIKQLTKKLNIQINKLIISGDEFGNTSSSSVPLAISSHYKKNTLLDKSENLLISGFGAGLSIGVGFINISNDSYFDIINYKKEN